MDRCGVRLVGSSFDRQSLEAGNVLNEKKHPTRPASGKSKKSNLNFLMVHVLSQLESLNILSKGFRFLIVSM